jgi:DNA-binding NtrC family response regulator
MNQHLLIVDDELSIRELLASYLGRAGYRVSTAGSAAEALKLAAEDPPRLVVSDLQLEDSDGLAVIERLRAALPGVPVILLTGVFFEPEVVEGDLSRRVSSYLQKTAPLSRILEEVRRFLG